MIKIATKEVKNSTKLRQGTWAASHRLTLEPSWMPRLESRALLLLNSDP